MSMPMAIIIQQILIPVLFALFSALLGWVSVNVTQWIRTKTHNEQIAAFVQHLTSVVAGSVQQVEVQYRPNLPERYMDTTGKLAPSGQRAMQKEARRLIRNQLPPYPAAVRRFIPDLDAYIDNQIERSIGGKH